MKKTLLLLSSMLLIFSLHAQVVITGVMADPRWYDARGDGATSQSVPHIGGFEYIQLRATEDIDFSATPFALIVARNDAANPVTANGWAEGGDITFKFSLTSGTVSKGNFFYVGGLEKRIAGYKNGRKSTDISETAPIEANRANWIRSINVSLGGDDGVGSAPPMATGLMYTINPYAIAVFDTNTVLSTTKPIDAVFFSPSLAAIDYIKYDSDGNKGYLVPDNDLYNSSESAYFCQNDKNTSYFETEQVAAPKNPVSKAQLNNGETWDSANTGTLSNNDEGYGWFCKLGGVYDLGAETWVTPRSPVYDRLMLVGTENSHQTLLLSRLETGTNITTLPVKLTSFAAQSNNYGILLKWTTLTETENSHFDVLRASDENMEFETIASVKGKGTSSIETHYNYRDQAPLNGTNYYKLRQVDNNGETAYSDVVFASTDINKPKLKVFSNKETIEFSIYSLRGGNSEIRFLNINGNTLKKENLYLNKGFNKLSWSNNFSNGVYIVKVSSSSELLKEKLIIK